MRDLGAVGKAFFSAGFSLTHERRLSINGDCWVGRDANRIVFESVDPGFQEPSGIHPTNAATTRSTSGRRCRGRSPMAAMKRIVKPCSEASQYKRRCRGRKKLTRQSPLARPIVFDRPVDEVCWHLDQRVGVYRLHPDQLRSLAMRRIRCRVATTWGPRLLRRTPAYRELASRYRRRRPKSMRRGALPPTKRQRELPAVTEVQSLIRLI